MQDGWGDLFHICRADKIHSDNFDYESTKVSNAPMGTYYSSDGGIIHAGSGAEHSDVRTILFWTWHSSSLTEYNVNEQETKFTLMIYLASEVWSELNDNEQDWTMATTSKKNNNVLALKEQMLRLLFYSFITMEDAYRSTCAFTFQDFLLVPNLITRFHDCTKNIPKSKYKARIEHDIKCFAKKIQLFDYKKLDVE